MKANQVQKNRFFELVNHTGEWLKHSLVLITPGQHAWQGAALGLLIAAAGLSALFAANNFLATPRLWSALIGFAALAAGCAIAGGFILLLAALFQSLPRFYRWALVATLPLLSMSFFTPTNISGAVVVGLGALVVCSLLGAGLGVLLSGGWPQMTTVQRVITFAGLILGLGGGAAGAAWLWLDDGAAVAPPTNAAALSATSVTPLELPDPSQRGPYAVQTLIYGSGQDLQRPEYGAHVALQTAPVDGSAFLAGWSDGRSDFWGFGPDSLPRNGRVWYPKGAGPFPLVLIVHGNHMMEAFSDPGYAYLGELLASRGFITVSIDENFLNYTKSEFITGAGLQEENDARGWLLLEHLRLWREWNGTTSNPFYGMVDMEKIALVGHSRGGEAVAVAALFNRLSRYPDNATVAFDYGFGIRGVVGLAPTIWQYLPADRTLVLEDVNYLVLHGAQDMDVSSFLGSKLYERVHFSSEQYSFKAGLYIYGANHGQFNTTWGRNDNSEPASRLNNLNQLMPAADQQKIAQVTVSAFMEATLHGESGYVALFRDPRTASAWLPEVIYLSQCEESTTEMISTYEEDWDTETTTLPGGRQLGANLTIWREQQVPLKVGRLETGAAYLGWDSTTSPEEASYTISLPEGLSLDAQSVLIFALADANLNPNPGRNKPTPAGPRAPIDLTIEVVDRAGTSARLPLSAFSLLQPQIQSDLGKASFVAGGLKSEVVFQTFEFPLEAFAKANPALDPTNLVVVRLILDRTPAGVIVLDDVGFRR